MTVSQSLPVSTPKSAARQAEPSAAFEPGPWSFSPQAGHPGHCQIAQVWDAKDRSLADIEPTDDPDVASATARLIAAAPDLLEALTTLTDNIEQAWPHLMHLGPLVAAREALAKAVGQP